MTLTFLALLSLSFVCIMVEAQGNLYPLSHNRFFYTEKQCSPTKRPMLRFLTDPQNLCWEIENVDILCMTNKLFFRQFFFFEVCQATWMHESINCLKWVEKQWNHFVLLIMTLSINSFVVQKEFYTVWSRQRLYILLSFKFLVLDFCNLCIFTRVGPL